MRHDPRSPWRKRWQGARYFRSAAHRARALRRSRLRALILMLRYSGMRIGDAVSCAVERLNGNKLLLYTQKTGVPVYCPLPDFVATALEGIPPTSERYFFLTGGSKLQTATGDWQAKLKKLFERATLSDGHWLRFRDTFASEVVISGVPMQRV